jgi:hypothetical protein
MNVEDIRKLAEYPQLKAENRTLRRSSLVDLPKLFDEIGVAIAAVEADADAHGLTGQMLGARDCLRAVAAIRERILGKPSVSESNGEP